MFTLESPSPEHQLFLLCYLSAADCESSSDGLSEARFLSYFVFGVAPHHNQTSARDANARLRDEHFALSLDPEFVRRSKADGI